MSAAQSPPGSQEDSVMTDAANNAAFLGEDEGFSAPRTPPPANGEKSSSTTNGVRSKKHATSSHGEPGSAWQNKKWEDDYAKAYAALQDQSWSMTHYGDPLLE